MTNGAGGDADIGSVHALGDQRIRQGACPQQAKAQAGGLIDDGKRCRIAEARHVNRRMRSAPVQSMADVLFLPRCELIRGLAETEQAAMRIGKGVGRRRTVRQGRIARNIETGKLRRGGRQTADLRQFPRLDGGANCVTAGIASSGACWSAVACVCRAGEGVVDDAPDVAVVLVLSVVCPGASTVMEEPLSLSADGVRGFADDERDGAMVDATGNGPSAAASRLPKLRCASSWSVRLVRAAGLGISGDVVGVRPTWG